MDVRLDRGVSPCGGTSARFVTGSVTRQGPARASRVARRRFEEVWTRFSGRPGRESRVRRLTLGATPGGIGQRPKVEHRSPFSRRQERYAESRLSVFQESREQEPAKSVARAVLARA